MSTVPFDGSRLTEHDLEPWERRALEQAYQERERKQASREDFAAGWIAALVAHRSTSGFLPGRLE
jgi:hypothetical protein